MISVRYRNGTHEVVLTKIADGHLQGVLDLAHRHFGTPGAVLDFKEGARIFRECAKKGKQ